MQIVCFLGSRITKSVILYLISGLKHLSEDNPITKPAFLFSNNQFVLLIEVARAVKEPLFYLLFWPSLYIERLFFSQNLLSLHKTSRPWPIVSTQSTNFVLFWLVHLLFQQRCNIKTTIAVSERTLSLPFTVFLVGKGV